MGAAVLDRNQQAFPPQPRGSDGPMATSLSARSIIVASPDQVSCPLGEESAILNLSNTVYYGLNPVGSRIWRLIQKPKSIGDLRDVLVDEYEVEPERCESDLLELLEKMRAEGLIEVSSSAAAG
jgi:Coenzyme PQQ synthesis protein D (PqqD)